MKRKVNFKFWLFCVISLSITFISSDAPLLAQTWRAFLVGINHYELPANTPLPQCRKEPLENLHGCINDVNAIKGLLVSRFGFQEENIKVLTDHEATRERIIANFTKYLIREVSPGDTCLFYFSGHGSWIINSLSNQSNKLDETLVPFDWYKGNFDIRDKELKRLFNQVLDKNAMLTVIVDACHSGSISRGFQDLQYREAPPNLCDAAEPPDGKEDPASRGALILSAAHEFQLASEINDEYGNRRGLFSWGLIKVLNQCPAHESIGSIMLRVDALMQSEGREQDVKLHSPGIEALAELRKRPLFAMKPGEDPGVAFAVREIDGKMITLQGGAAAGLREKCQLQKISANSAESLIMVEVTSVTGLNICQAKVIVGDREKIKRGDLFKIHKWVVPRETRMRVWIPAGPYSPEDLTQFANKIAELQHADEIVWVHDPAEQKPTHTISWYKSSWQLQTWGKKTVSLGKQPGPGNILQAIRAHPSLDNGKPYLFLQLPLSAPLNNALLDEITDYKDSVEILASKEEAIYMLAGRIVNGKIEYAWRIPGVTEKKERGFSLPVKPYWVEAGKIEKGLRETTAQLGDMLLQLVKVRGWFQLETPPLSWGEKVFPYRLALKNAATGEYKTTGPLVGGEPYGLVLQADRDLFKMKKEQRFVYVFLIDSRGDSTLLFPRKERFNTEIHFPAADDWPLEIPLGGKKLFNISDPFGMDTYILLTTAEPISNPDVLDFKGVRSAEKRGTLPSVLERLLYDLSTATRSPGQAAPTNWSIQRLQVLSIESK